LSSKLGISEIFEPRNEFEKPEKPGDEFPKSESPKPLLEKRELPKFACPRPDEKDENDENLEPFVSNEVFLAFPNECHWPPSPATLPTPRGISVPPPRLSLPPPRLPLPPRLSLPNECHPSPAGLPNVRADAGISRPAEFPNECHPRVSCESRPAAGEASDRPRLRLREDISEPKFPRLEFEPRAKLSAKLLPAKLREGVSEPKVPRPELELRPKLLPAKLSDDREENPPFPA
jgi:hypothetical protein